MERVRLINERKMLKLSRKQVAEMLGISEIYVRKLEKGASNPGRNTLLKFEMLYGVRDRDLFPDLFQVYFDTKRIVK